MNYYFIVTNFHSSAFINELICGGGMHSIHMTKKQRWWATKTSKIFSWSVEIWKCFFKAPFKMFFEITIVTTVVWRFLSWEPRQKETSLRRLNTELHYIRPKACGNLIINHICGFSIKGCHKVWSTQLSRKSFCVVTFAISSLGSGPNHLFPVKRTTKPLCTNLAP